MHINEFDTKFGLHTSQVKLRIVNSSTEQSSRTELKKKKILKAF